MASCPKCGRKLKLTNISQFCPGCGVNMRFVDFEENFIREAKIAELSQATVHVKIKRLKAAFIGTKLNIVRLVVVLLPIVALLVPVASFEAVMPFRNLNVSLGGLGIYQMFTNGDFNFINSMVSSDLFGAEFSALRLALFSYAAIALFSVAVLFSTILCFISYKNMQKVIAGISFAGIAVTVVNAVLTAKAVSACKADGGLFTSASNGFGVYVVILAFAVVAAVNLILVKKGIPVEYDEGMLERLDIWRKVKSGEVKIDDLPQPVVETAATRKIDEEIRKEEEDYLRLHSEKKDDEGGEDK